MSVNGNPSVFVNFSDEGIFAPEFHFDYPLVQMNQSMVCLTLYQKFLAFKNLTLEYEGYSKNEIIKISTGIYTRVIVDPACYDYTKCYCNTGYLDLSDKGDLRDCVLCSKWNITNFHVSGAICPGNESKKKNCF